MSALPSLLKSHNNVGYLAYSVTIVVPPQMTELETMSERISGMAVYAQSAVVPFFMAANHFHVVLDVYKSITRSLIPSPFRSPD